VASGRPDTSSRRRILLVTHTGRATAVDVARDIAKRLIGAGLDVNVLADEVGELDVPGCQVTDPTEAARDCEVAVVLGGDGTILRGAELTRVHGTAVLGVNLGHVGFLAEAERNDVVAMVDDIVDRRYTVEERMTIDVRVIDQGRTLNDGWALNEASVEKAARSRMIEVMVEIDGRPLSRWGCDGVVCATPTGSTAYNFSAGGPIVWPDVSALLLVPLSAHALFARPMVVSPESVISVELLTRAAYSGLLWCDGRREVDLPAGARVEVSRSATPVRLARLNTPPFTDRLVAKFGLPVAGWRGRRSNPTYGPE
jgi:NAD+ kinase